MSLLNIDRARSLKDRINEAADPTVGALVAKYGTDVNRLKIDTAAGKVNPTNAVMAMMMIQRIVASQTQPPSGTTVAQDTGVAPPPQAGLSAMAPQGAPGANPVRMAYGGQVAVSNNQVPSPAMERGLSGLPVPDNMFDYADGGMIAFAGGGDVQRFQNAGAVRVGQPSDLRLAGFTWDQLPVEDSGMYGPMTRGIAELFSRPMNQRKKRDPNTGEYITYSEFIERAGQPQRGAMPQNMSADMQKYLQQYEQGQRGTMTAPPGADATGKPKIDPFAAAKQNVLDKESSRVGGTGETAGSSFAPRSLEDILKSIQSDSRGETAEQYGRRVGQLNVDTAGFVKPEAPLTPTKAIEKVNEADVAAGVDPKFFEKLQGRINTMREEAKTDKKEAANMRLLEAGLGILGGTSPYAFVNIGKGASEAAKGFGQDLKDYQKARRELDKSEMELQSAEQTAARTKSAKALDMVEKSQTRFDNATNKVAEAKVSAINSATTAFITEEQIRSGERSKAADIASREKLGFAQIQAQDRQTNESIRARVEATKLQFGAKVASDLERTISNAAKPFDEQKEILIKSIPFGMAYTPDVVKQLNDLSKRRADAIDLAEKRYLLNVSKNTGGNNRFPGFVDLTNK